MGIFKNLLDVFRPEADPTDALLKALIGNNSISKTNAMKIPAVSKNVGLITDMISTIPIKLYRRDKDGKTVEVDDERVNLLNKDTKDTLSGPEFKRAIVEDYLLEKGGYAIITKRPNSNKVASLNYVKAEYVNVMVGNDVVNKEIAFSIGGISYDKMNVIRVLRNSKNGASGTSIVEQVEAALNSAYQSMVYQLNLVQTGGNKRGFLKSQRKLSEPAMNELKSAWKRMYEDGSENCIVLNDGVEFQEASATSVEMQLNESINSFNKQIDEIFRYDSDFFVYFKKAITPILREFEASLNRDLLLEKEKNTMWFEFDTKDILKGNLKERYEAYRIAKDTGWLTLNEIRTEENKEAIDGLDIVAMSLGQVVFDINTGKYFVPNTGENINLDGKGGNGDE